MAPSYRLKISLKRRRIAWAPGLLALAGLVGCSSPRQLRPHGAETCAKLENTLADQENAFVARVRATRERHILLVDYDREMIAALTARRAALEATALADTSANEEIGGCSGKPLADLRVQAQEEMTRLQRFLNTFQRAVKEDPAGVFIDQP
jgi:hypothetical protein